MYGAVSSWCEEFAQRTPNQQESIAEKFAAEENEQLLNNVQPQEVNSLVQTPRSDNWASGNRLRECLQRFETLEKDIQFTKVCEDATFARRVSVRMRYETIPDVGDGFGDRTPACREYTLPREDPMSRIYATIPGQTAIGPALQVRVTRCLDISGIESQIPSTTTKDRKSWVVMCRGNNRYVEELARGLGSPRHDSNRRRRAREAPEPACVLHSCCGGAHAGEEGREYTSCRVTVQSAWQVPSVRRTEGRPGCPQG